MHEKQYVKLSRLLLLIIWLGVLQSCQNKAEQFKYDLIESKLSPSKDVSILDCQLSYRVWQPVKSVITVSNRDLVVFLKQDTLLQLLDEKPWKLTYGENLIAAKATSKLGTLSSFLSLLDVNGHVDLGTTGKLKAKKGLLSKKVNPRALTVTKQEIAELFGSFINDSTINHIDKSINSISPISGIDFDLELVFENQYGVSMSVQDIQMEFDLNSDGSFEGQWTLLKQIDIPAGEKKKIELEAHLSTLGAISNLGSFLGKRKEVRSLGSATILIKGYQLKIPLDINLEI